MSQHKRTIEEQKILEHGIREAQWFIDHVMGKEKRVDWGNTFSIDWGRVNTALIDISKAAQLAGGKKK